VNAEPDLVQGAWTRRSASIDGGPHFETQLVVWLQVGTCYADLRVPLHPKADERCFTGRSFWEGDLYRWTHDLDLEAINGVSPPAADDVGELKWRTDALVETGAFPTASGSVPYEEVWVRLPGGENPWLAMEADGACLIRVGDHAITVVDHRHAGGEFAACYRVLGPDGWRTTAAIGPAATLPGPDESTSGWRVIHSGSRERAKL
jgi:hypothetical protein